MYNPRNQYKKPVAVLSKEDKKLISQIIIDKNAAGTLVSYADRLGKQLKEEDLKASQIRAVFDEVRQIEALWLQDEEKALYRVHLLKPKLAYRAAREKKGVPALKEVLTLAIDLVVEKRELAKERFRRFTEFFEAIIAYHKAHGGKD